MAPAGRGAGAEDRRHRAGHLGAPAFAAALDLEASASATAALRDRLSDALDVDAANNDRTDVLTLIDRIDLAPGHVAVAVDRMRLSDLAGVSADSVPLDALLIAAAFQTRKRGAETRLILGAEPSAEIDRTLLINVATGHAWFERIKAGVTYESIVASNGVSKRRVMQLVELAFLSPEIVRKVLDGHQPAGLTTDLLLKRGFPLDWAEQRRLFDSL